MKRRYICFISVIVLLFIIFVFFKNKPNNYSLEYSKDDYLITESYNKDKEIYTFKLVNGEYIFYYAIKHDYTSKRRLLNKFEEEKDKDKICLKISLFDTKQETICSDTKEYTINNMEESKKSQDRKVALKYEDVKVYDDSYNLYEWNGYGFTHINGKKKYNVLKKERYNNDLSYSMDNYIVFPNYDEKNEYSFVYIFDTKSNKYSKVEFKDKLSSDSYFQGSVDGLIYLFDRKHSVQYTINPSKKELKIANDSEGAYVYDGEFSTQPLKNFKYKNLVFTYDNVRNYTLSNDYLYMNYFSSNDKIKLFNDKINAIISSDEDKVIFLSGSNAYVYKYNKGIEKIANSLQWEFHYKSQIYIF